MTADVLFGGISAACSALAAGNRQNALTQLRTESQEADGGVR